MSLFVQIQHEFFGELDKQQKCTDPVVPDSQRLWSKNDKVYQLNSYTYVQAHAQQYKVHSLLSIRCFCHFISECLKQTRKNSKYH